MICSSLIKVISASITIACTMEKEVIFHRNGGCGPWPSYVQSALTR